MQYFGSNIVEGVAEGWVEAEMSWVEVGGAGWRLKLAGWRWVHGLAITKLYYTKSLSGKGILHFEERRTVKAMSKGGYT